MFVKDMVGSHTSIWPRPDTLVETRLAAKKTIPLILDGRWSTVQPMISGHRLADFVPEVWEGLATSKSLQNVQVPSMVPSKAVVFILLMIDIACGMVSVGFDAGDGAHTVSSSSTDQGPTDPVLLVALFDRRLRGPLARFVAGVGDSRACRRRFFCCNLWAFVVALIVVRCILLRAS